MMVIEIHPVAQFVLAIGVAWLFYWIGRAIYQLFSGRKDDNRKVPMISVKTVKK